MRKIDHIKELIRKLMVQSHYHIYLLHKYPLNSAIADDYEKILLHLNIVDLINNCSYQNAYGVMQIRKMVSMDSLYDAILAHAVPFRMKTSYLRLLYNGFI